jgi:hypothetical protein
VTGFGDPCGDEIGELIHQSFPGIREIWLNPETAPPIPGVGGAFQISPAWMEIFRRVFACPEMTSAAAALQADPIVSPAISSGMAHFGVSRSGGVLQPTTLPYGLIQAACVEIAASGVTLTEELLTEMTLDNLRRVRAGVSGETYESLMLTTFIGVRMTPGMKTHTPWGPLVDASRLASEIFFGPFVSGSAILMTPIRSFLRPGAGIGSETSPETKQLRSETRRNAFLVTYGLTLGSDHDNPGTMISARTGELLPTGLSGFGGGVSLLGLQNRNRTPITQA